MRTTSNKNSFGPGYGISLLALGALFLVICQFWGYGKYPNWKLLVLAELAMGIVLTPIISWGMQHILTSGGYIIPASYPKLVYIVMYFTIYATMFLGGYLNEQKVNEITCYRYHIEKKAIQGRYGQNLDVFFNYGPKPIKLTCGSKFYNYFQARDSVAVCLNRGLLGFSFFTFDNRSYEK